jgi:hypothetical protein
MSRSTAPGDALEASRSSYRSSGLPFLEVFPVDYEALDAYIDELAALSDLTDPAAAHARSLSNRSMSPAGL